MNEPMQSDPAIQRKNDLTIALENGYVRVFDSEGKGGGNVRSRGGTTIRWRNATDLVCVLKFREFLADDEEGDGEGHWPFRDEPNAGPYERAIQPGARWDGKLRRGIEAFIKYDVVLLNGATVVARLDPIIIVERRS